MEFSAYQTDSSASFYRKFKKMYKVGTFQIIGSKEIRGKNKNFYGLTLIIILVALHNVTSREKAGFVSLVKSLIHGWLKMVMTTSAGRLL